MQGIRVPDRVRREIRQAMNERPRRVTPSELARLLNLSRMTINRITREPNDDGDTQRLLPLS